VTACFRWVLKEGDKGQGNENSRRGDSLGSGGEASLQRFELATEPDHARELTSRSGPHKTALEPPRSGGQNRTTQTYVVVVTYK
jgi:hypothetical protein